MAEKKTKFRWRRKRVLSRQSLHHQVADELRDMIIHGQLEEGGKIPIADLATDLGVSMTPVREALKVLAADNLVELLPNRGARVTAHTVDDAEKLFEVIAGLEGLAAELAATRMSDAELGELEAMHAHMRGLYEARQRTEYFDLNSQIHAAIIDCADNDVLRATHQKLSVRANRGRYLAINDPKRWAQAMDEHEQVMQAFRQRSAESARAVWSLHMRHTAETICDVMRRHAEEAGADEARAAATEATDA